MDQRLLNGKPKVTLIQRFDHSILILGPKIEKIEFKNLKLAKSFVEEKGYEIKIAHLHPGQIEKD